MSLRSIIWFERGEAGEIWEKLTSPKFRYEADNEVAVLGALVCGVALAFAYAVWAGIGYCVAFKWAIQALNEKGFFDSSEGNTPKGDDG